MSKRKSGATRRKELREQSRPRETGMPARCFAMIGGLVILVIAVFGRAWAYPFVDWDDPDNITTNPLYQPTATSHLLELWTVPYYAAYIPITRLFWAFLAGTTTAQTGVTVAQFDPHAYHAANLIMHCLNSALVFLFLRVVLRRCVLEQVERVQTGVEASDTLATRIDWASVGGAAIFAIHPLQVEPVAWVTGMKDVLCGFFSLCALYFYVLSIPQDGQNEKRGLPLAVSSAAYVLAILSKSSAVTLPVIAFVLDWCIRRPSPGQPWWRMPVDRAIILAAWLVAAIPIIAVTKYAENLAGIRIPMVPVWQRPFVMGDTLAFYLWKCVVPLRLGPDYGRTPTWLMSHGWAYGSIAAPAILAALAWMYRRRLPWAPAAFGIWFFSLLPSSGITPFDFQLFSSTADRYMYFAMVGIALAAAGVLISIPARVSHVLSVLVPACLTVLSFSQVSVWSSTEALFTQGLQVNPRSAISYLSVGKVEEAKGHFDVALADYRKAVELHPTSEQAQNDLGALLGRMWNDGSKSEATQPILLEAQQHLETAIRLRDNFPEGHSNLANVYFSEHRYAEALAQYQAALKFNPNDAPSLYMAGLAANQLGNVDLYLQYLRQSADLGFGPAIKVVSPSPGNEQAR